MIAELTDYFTTASDQLYHLLNKDTELYRIMHAIEVLTNSNRTLNDLRIRQEQYMLSRFQLALQNGLQGRLLPLVEQRRTTSDHSTFAPRQTISRSDLCDN
jgi:hypothetical protein